MDKIQDIIKYYNKNQDEWWTTDYNDDYQMYVEEYDDNQGCCLNSGDKYWIGFYEWLFNPKYKVFEIFKVKTGSVMEAVILSYDQGDKVYAVPEILEYLYKQIKPKE